MEINIVAKRNEHVRRESLTLKSQPIVRPVSEAPRNTPRRLDSEIMKVEDMMRMREAGNQNGKQRGASVFNEAKFL